MSTHETPPKNRDSRVGVDSAGQEELSSIRHPRAGIRSWKLPGCQGWLVPSGQGMQRAGDPREATS